MMITRIIIMILVINFNYLLQSQSVYFNSDGQTLNISDRVQVPSRFKGGFVISGQNCIPKCDFDFSSSGAWGTIVNSNSDGAVKILFDRQKITESVGLATYQKPKEIYFGPFEYWVDSSWLKWLEKQNGVQSALLENTPNSNQNFGKNNTVSQKTNLQVDYNRIKPIAAKINKQIAQSICPNTAKDGVYYILSYEDNGDYILVDLMSQWTGAACGVCDWETYYTKEKVYLNKPNYEISKIDVYYKSANVSQVWSTSDVLAGLAVLATGAAILNSGDDSKSSNNFSTVTNNSSSSKQTGSTTTSSYSTPTTTPSQPSYKYKVGQSISCSKWDNGSGWEGVITDKRDGNYQVELTKINLYGWIALQLNAGSCSGNKVLKWDSLQYQKVMIWVDESCID